MTRTRIVVLCAAGALAALGCNALLGNEEGTLGAGGPDAAAAEAAPSSPPAGDAASDAGVTVFEGGAAFDAAVTCPPTKRLCSTLQACVEPLDPNFGCGSGGCGACGADNTTSVACQPIDGGSVFGCVPNCKAGFADCNKDASDGCEADLTRPVTCGSCNQTCDGGLLCTRSDAGPVATCVATCSTGLVNCGSGQCVNTATDPNHCGGCAGDGGTKCPEPANGSAICVGGNCGIECDGLSHKCDKGCFPNGDPTHCGAACIDCTAKVPPNTAPATCQDGRCTWGACQSGWADCNGDLEKGPDGDGCEKNIARDVSNCGKCGNVCNGIQVAFGPPIVDTQQCCAGNCISSLSICKE